MNEITISGYRYASAELNQSHDWLLPSVLGVLDGLDIAGGGGAACSSWAAATAAWREC